MMNQLSLFDAAPMARPARPDTTMLLAMSHDHQIGAPDPRATAHTWPQPNENGVYATQDAENIVLPNPRKGWRGGPLAEIHLLQLAEGWIYETAVMMPNQGYCGPLSTHGGFCATRGEALAMSVQRIVKYCTRDQWDYESDSKIANKIRAWANGLGGML